MCKQKGSWTLKISNRKYSTLYGLDKTLNRAASLFPGFFLPSTLDNTINKGCNTKLEIPFKVSKLRARELMTEHSHEIHYVPSEPRFLHQNKDLTADPIPWFAPLCTSPLDLFYTRISRGVSFGGGTEPGFPQDEQTTKPSVKLNFWIRLLNLAGWAPAVYCPSCPCKKW